MVVDPFLYQLLDALNDLWGFALISRKHGWIDDFVGSAWVARSCARSMEMGVTLRGVKLDETVGDNLVGHAQVSQRYGLSMVDHPGVDQIADHCDCRSVWLFGTWQNRARSRARQ
jgi:hypothetical protein